MQQARHRTLAALTTGALTLAGTAFLDAAPASADALSFTNPATITVPAVGTGPGTASPYPSEIVVANLAGSITEVTVTLTHVTHAFADDIDLLLVGPAGQNLILMSDALINSADSTFTLDDDAAAGLPDDGSVASGTYKPSNYAGFSDDFPGAPPVSSATTLSTFDGTIPNGTWRLYASDDAGGDTGTIGGWTLTIQTFTPAAACDGVPQSTFTDRAAANVHVENLDCVAAYGFAQGYPDGTYRPSLPVSRAQMASFVARLVARAGLALPAAPPDAFPGDHGNVHELAIDQLAAVGILDDTTGQSGTFYRVAEPMARDDMAGILANAYHALRGDGPVAAPDAFGDDNGNDNELAINWLAANSVVEGTAPGTYNPDGTVTRAQFTSFFARFIQLVIDRGGVIPRS